MAFEICSSKHFFDSFQCLFQLFFLGAERYADVSPTIVSEDKSWRDKHFRLVQHAFGELLLCHAIFLTVVGNLESDFNISLFISVHGIHLKTIVSA